MVIYATIGLIIGLINVAFDERNFFIAWGAGILVGIGWPLVVLIIVNTVRKG